jgi:carbon storage regulator CsrA
MTVQLETKRSDEMLVLTRHTDERIIIRRQDGTEIVIVIVQVDRALNKVRLGFEAPNDTAIWREEIDPQRHPRPSKGVL